MSAVRTYLEAKTADPNPKEWLRREPRSTHPEILEHVRAFKATGDFNNDAAERYIIEQVGDLPAHHRHGHDDRHPLITQLGHEVYLANGILADEKGATQIEAAQADGFMPLDAVELVEGARYLIKLGTIYCGNDVPVYGDPKSVRAHREQGRMVFLPKGAKTRYFVPGGPALIKAA